jgi:pimeloyl-ACP methyl ester carboxylesterase
VLRALRPLLIAFLTVLLASSTTERPTAQKPPSGPAPGVLVDIGGHKLHIRCVGPVDARPIVILEAGGGGFSNAWTRVQDALSPRIRTCAYDRAGLGWSEAGPTPRTMKQEVFELHALLTAANIPGPYVLVGHSIGGLLVRRYTEQYGSDVLGVVLAAATHESARLGVIGKGWVRVREQATGRVVPEPRTAITASKAQTRGYEPAEDYLAEEFQQMYLSRKASPEMLGDRPLIVLAPTRPDPPPPGTSDDLWNELRLEKGDQAMGLVLLSKNSKVVRDPLSGHNIQVDNPQLVARAIGEVVEAAVKGTKLGP